MRVNSTQSRKGSRGNCPLRSPEAAPLVGLGQRPNCFSGAQFKRSSQQRRRQRSVPAKLRASSDAPPSCSFDQLCCVAPNGRDRIAWLPVIAGLFRKQGISRLRARVGGLCGRPPTPLRSAHPCGLIFIVAGGLAPAGASRGLCGRPPTPLRSAHPCSLTVIVGWENRNCPPICATILSTCRRA